jgi:hypothetical protein
MSGDLHTRIRAYIAKLPVAISGSGGHVATLKVANALVIGFNLSIDQARFYLLEYNENCQPPWSKRELEHKLNEANANKHGLVRGWLLDRSPTSQQPSAAAAASNRPNRQPVKKLSRKEQAERAVHAIKTKLAGFEADLADVWEASPVRLLDDYTGDARLAISSLCAPSDLINVNCKYRLNPKDHRVVIVGSGVSRSAAEWDTYLSNHPAPYTEAGCWWRPNPIRAWQGSGHDGAFTDADIATFRYHLFEIDAVPMNLQLSFFCKIQAPIAMISDSGGRSYHALIKSSARTLIEYQAEAAYLLDNLFARYGVDFQNKNPSRYSRLPGVPRSIGARALLPGETEACQNIVYLNPHPTKGPIL